MSLNSSSSQTTEGSSALVRKYVQPTMSGPEVELLVSNDQVGLKMRHESGDTQPPLIIDHKNAKEKRVRIPLFSIHGARPKTNKTSCVGREVPSCDTLIVVQNRKNQKKLRAFSKQWEKTPPVSCSFLPPHMLNKPSEPLPRASRK